MSNTLRKKILVIGNQGYVGSVLVGDLKKNISSEIIGFDCGIYSKLITSAYNPDQFLDHHFNQDVRNFDPQILKNVYAVIYLAAISNDPMGNKYEALTRDINYLCCIKIANKAKRVVAEVIIVLESVSFIDRFEISSIFSL